MKELHDTRRARDSAREAAGGRPDRPIALGGGGGGGSSSDEIEEIPDTSQEPSSEKVPDNSIHQRAERTIRKLHQIDRDIQDIYEGALQKRTRRSL